MKWVVSMKKEEFIFKHVDKLLNLENAYNLFFEQQKFLEVEDVEYFEKVFLFPKKEQLQITLNPFYYYVYYKKYLPLYQILFDKWQVFSDRVEEHNKQYIQEKIMEFRSLCGTIENRHLDNHQVEAIIQNNNNVLVIAGAGTGKTTTIIGKVKYLIKKGTALPEEILLLSFTHASAEELKERIEKEIHNTIATSTFHKLGLSIIQSCRSEPVIIYGESLQKFILEQIRLRLSDPQYLRKLIHFCEQGKFDNIDDFKFQSEEEYQEYLKTNPPTTLKGEIVKSYGELTIANFLFENGIEYEYENAYIFKNKDEEFSYHPDFHICNSNVYIEYYGIDEDGHIAPFIKGRYAEEEYNKNIIEKRKLHKDNETKLIECYYYEHYYKTLLFNLKVCLETNKIPFHPKSEEELWEEINRNNKNVLNVVASLFETIINLMKSNNYNIDHLRTICNTKEENLINNLLVIDLLEPIYNAYNDYLKNHNQIDFNDMINLAANYITEGKYLHNYKYVIVDEYQDISKSRYRLLKAMRTTNNYHLFCVGDDWQSIYRFSGSELDLMTKFESFWGKTYYSKIENTYRFSDTLAKISSNFIIQNKNQIQKNITGFPSSRFPIGLINGYTEKKMIEFFEEKLNSLKENSTVFLIGRYNFDIDILKDNNHFKWRYIISENLIQVKYIYRKDLNIKFVTAHKSKGLQADYVFIINNKDTGMGFPSKISDISLIRIILSNEEDYPFSEERRLFYVAITRSKKKTYFLTVENNKSLFVKELESVYHKEFVFERYECPNCKEGRLKSFEGQTGKYYKCFKCNYIKK